MEYARFNNRCKGNVIMYIVEYFCWAILILNTIVSMYRWCFTSILSNIILLEPSLSVRFTPMYTYGIMYFTIICHCISNNLWLLLYADICVRRVIYLYLVTIVFSSVHFYRNVGTIVTNLRHCFFCRTMIHNSHYDMMQGINFHYCAIRNLIALE